MPSKTVDIMEENSKYLGATRSAGHSFFQSFSSAIALFFSKNTFEFHLIRGRILYGLNQYDKAIGDFQIALRLDWRHEQAAVWMRMAELACGRRVNKL